MIDTKNKWADPGEQHLHKLRHELLERRTYTTTPEFGEVQDCTLREASIHFDEAGRPLNPRGRTGLRGRGLLSKWGPNHAADPVVTRVHPYTGKLQMIARKRTDTGDWSIPGAMFKPGLETVLDVLKSIFELSVFVGFIFISELVGGWIANFSP